MVLTILIGFSTACGKPQESAVSTAQQIAQQTPITITDARIRELIPGRDITAAYFTMRNNTAHTWILSEVTSATATDIQIHETADDDGQMQMRQLTQLRISPGEQIKFEPGGLHLMVFGVTALDGPFEADLILHNSNPPAEDQTPEQFPDRNKSERITVSFSKLAL